MTTRFALFAALMSAAASTALAQVDASSLHAKYGAPLDRETFMVRPGIEMIVDYGPNKQACKIQLPSGVHYVGVAPDGAITKEQIDEVLEEVLPSSNRGKEMNRMMTATGAPMLSVVDYERVSISEFSVGHIGKGITIRFKDSGCPAKVGQ